MEEINESLKNSKEVKGGKQTCEWNCSTPENRDRSHKENTNERNPGNGKSGWANRTYRPKDLQQNKRVGRETLRCNKINRFTGLRKC